MVQLDDFFGPNAGYAAELFERYQRDPQAVDGATRALFARNWTRLQQLVAGWPEDLRAHIQRLTEPAAR